MRTFALFHPASGFPGAAYVQAQDEDLLKRRVVFVTETLSRANGGGGAWPADVASALGQTFGYDRAPRPANPSDVPSIDIHLEHREPLRDGGVGDIETLMASDALHAERF